MFILVPLLDGIRIPASEFETRSHEGERGTNGVDDTLAREIEMKYVNRVLPGAGLVVALHSIEERGEAALLPGDASAFTPVAATLLCFRPAAGEILEGSVYSCEASGIRVSLDFFEDIYIPPSHMRDHATFDADREAWMIPFDGSPDPLDVRRGDRIRLRVMGVSFRTDSSSHSAPTPAAIAPIAPASRAGAQKAAPAASSSRPGDAAASTVMTTIAALPARNGWMVVGGGDGEGTTLPPTATSAAGVTYHPQEVGHALAFSAKPLDDVSVLPGSGFVIWGGASLLCPPASTTAAISSAQHAPPPSSNNTSKIYGLPSDLVAESAGTVGIADAGRGFDAAMVIIGNIREDGMGCVGWWDGEAAAESHNDGIAAM